MKSALNDKAKRFSWFPGDKFSKISFYFFQKLDVSVLAKFYKVHFRASILARLSYQKSLKKLGWRVISKKNLLVRLTGASMRAICCVMSSTFHLKALITDK